MQDSKLTGGIPLREVEVRPVAPSVAEPPYRLFIGAALALALGIGILLALLLPLAQVLEWDWGRRWPEFAQAHGQAQLLGFAGLFIGGMALRMMPRFSARPLAYRAAAPLVVVLIAGGVAVRSIAPLLDADLVHGVASIGGAASVFAGALVLFSMIARTLVHRDSKAEATAWFFLLGGLGFVGSGALLLVLSIRAVDHDSRVIAPLENNALLAAELFGFVLMFMGGVMTRAVPTFAGRQRSQIVARVAAVLLAVGVASYTAITLVIADGHRSVALTRVAAASLIAISAGLLMIVWATGVFQPRANRVAAASQLQFWFIRSGCAWLVAAALLLARYAVPALTDGKQLDQFQQDAIRHVTTVGVVMMVIIGMSLLIVPEFAGRRIQHAGERWPAWIILASVNAAVILRAWPPLEGIDWLSTDRYWPMVAAAGLAMASLGLFGTMLLQSYLEQRRPDWSSPEGLARRRRRRG